MAITFYQQKRYDSGIRTGLDVDGVEVFHHFEPGDAEDGDNALLWFVDVRCNGDSLPTDAEKSRRWLKRNSSRIERELAAAAEHLEVGMDADIIPYMHKVDMNGSRASIVIAVHCARRITGLQIANEVRRIGKDWKKLLASFEPLNTRS